jgi:hypothetical protein
LRNLFDCLLGNGGAGALNLIDKFAAHMGIVALVWPEA